MLTDMQLLVEQCLITTAVDLAISMAHLQQFVRGLRVVLANGEYIETGRLTKRELSKKLGLASFEGEIYRSLDKLIEESTDILSKLSLITDHSAAGYDISDVKQKDGSFRPYTVVCRCSRYS
jgi:hypothetical protein